MKEVFRDPQNAIAFDALGYVILPTLNSGDIDYLASLYQQVDARQYPVLELREAESLHKAVADLLSQRLDQHLRDFEAIGGAFVTKHGGKGMYEPHQDCTWVDESVDCMISVWIPLLDVTLADGVLAVIPGSHRLPLPTHRIRLRFLDPLLMNYFEMLPVKRGEAVLFNNRLIHGSLPNWSGVNRITVIGAAKHRNARLISYATDGEKPGAARVYGVDIAFMQTHSPNTVRDAAALGKPFDMSAWPYLETIECMAHDLSPEEWRRVLCEHGIGMNPKIQSLLAQHAS